MTDGSTFNLSYTNPAANPPTGTATITFSSTAATLASNIQTALSSGGLATQIGTNPGAGGTPNSVVTVINDTSAGANVVVTFQSALAQAVNHQLTSSTAGLAISAATINTSNNMPNLGIPIALTSGVNVTSGSFTLQYNPSLLTISGAVSKVVGASFTLVSNDTNLGIAVLSLSSPTRISSTTQSITVGSLLATVPLSAASSYGAKQLLHFSNEQLGGTAGPIAVTNEDGVEVAAYVGDVMDTGSPFTLQDAAAIAAAAAGVPNTTAQTIPGFAAFPNLDPVIIGDVSLQGIVNSTDAGVMTQQLGGTARTTIPYPPVGLPITPVGPNPTLTVAPGVWMPDGATVLVPVNIDTARPMGSTGMVDAMLAFSYDPTVFDVAAAGVQLGTVPQAGSGWELKTEINKQTGLIGVELFSNTPIASANAGSLVTIAMHVRDAVPSAVVLNERLIASPLSLVPYVDPTGGLRVYQTQVSDAQGAFVIDVVNNEQAAINTEPVRQGSAANATAVSMVVEDQSTDIGHRTSDIGQATGFNPLSAVEQVFVELQQSANCPLQPSSYCVPLADSDLDHPDWLSEGILNQNDGLQNATREKNVFPPQYFDTYLRPELLNQVFLAMSFGDEFTNAWKDIIQHAVDEN